MEEIKKNFELDYWGLTYREGLEYILKNDKRDTIKIACNTIMGKVNFDIFPLKEKKRLVYVKNPEEAVYYLSNYNII